MGVEQFYIYDNWSEDTDNLFRILNKYNKYITLIKWPFAHSRLTKNKYSQPGAFNHSIYKYGNTKRMIICDVDEFIVPLKYNSLRDLIVKYSKYYVIQIETCWFGNNIEKQLKPVLQNFMYRKRNSEGNEYGTKCIVDPSKIKLYGVHHPIIIKNEGYNEHNIERFGNACYYKNDKDSKTRLIELNPSDVIINHYYYFSNWRKDDNKREKIDFEIYDNNILRFI